MHFFALVGVVLLAIKWFWSLFLFVAIAYSFRYNLRRYYALSHPYSIVEMRLNGDDQLSIKRNNGKQDKVCINHASVFMGNYFITISYNKLFKQTLILQERKHSKKDLHEMILRVKFNGRQGQVGN